MKTEWSKEHYHLKDDKVRWRSYEVKGADPATFEPLSHIWARDARRVYTQHSVNKLADRETFEVLNHIFARDKNRVFYLSGWIKEADVTTFQVLDEGRFPQDETPVNENDPTYWCNRGFACDAQHVFFDDMLEGKPCVLRGADPKTFEVLEFGYGKDSNAVYCEKRRIKGASPSTFQQLNRYFSKDDRAVYYAERAIANADSASFEVMKQFWARDAARVFFQENVVPADRATFELIDRNFGRDARRVFGFLGEVVNGADPKSFQRVGSTPWSLYYRDKNGVYYTGYPGGWIEGADPATFRGDKHPSGGDAWDKNWIYRGMQRWRPTSEFKE